MAKEQYIIEVVNKNGKVLASEDTGLIYDGSIKAHYISEDFKKTYPDMKIVTKKV